VRKNVCVRERMRESVCERKGEGERESERQIVHVSVRESEKECV
jgi:hypothetical protein